MNARRAAPLHRDDQAQYSTSRSCPSSLGDAMRVLLAAVESPQQREQLKADFADYQEGKETSSRQLASPDGRQRAFRPHACRKSAH